MENIELRELMGGALQEQFAKAFERVIENLQNPNTPYKAMREITVKLKFTQNEQRDDVKCGISVTEKLAAHSPMETSFAIGKAMHIHEAVASELAIPVAFATMGTGLFIVCARRKAITQVVGFLAFENGIAVFGSGILLEYGIVVELGILLDVFVLVFVLGIAIHQISRTFSSIDTDRLNRLGDTHLLHPRGKASR